MMILLPSKNLRINEWTNKDLITHKEMEDLKKSGPLSIPRRGTNSMRGSRISG